MSTLDPKLKFGMLSLSCLDCPMMPLSEWHVLDDADRETLAEAKSTRSFAKGEVIFFQGDPCDGIYCVKSGTAGVRKTDEKGNAVLLYLVHPGETMGMRSFFAGTEFQASAEALEPVSVCFIPGGVLKKLSARNPQLDLAFLKHISRELGDAHKTILANTSLPVRARMAHFILSLKDRYGEENKDGTLSVRLPLTRHDIADLLATRPETVARAIASLTKDGLARFSGRQVVILKPDSLQEESEALTE